MKPNTKTLLIIGALGAAAVYAASKSSAFSDSGAEGAGSLGGDDSITAEGNPFARIDPNYQYPGPSNNYFMVQPDGSVTPIVPNPDTGAVTIPTPDGSETVNVPGSPDIGPASTGATAPSGPAWYENPLVQGAGFAAGYLAVEGTIAGVKKISGGKTSGEKLVTEAKATSEAKLKTTEKSPINEVREKMGFRANERLPEQEILRAKYTTEADFSTGKVSEIKGTGKVMAEEPTGTGKVKFGETKIGKTAGEVGETAGKALIIGHVVSRSFNAWNEYGSQYIEPRYNSKGEVVGATAGSTAKAVAVTGATATTGILGDLFAFGTGLIYRPGTKAEEFKDQTTGWFATERDLFTVGKEALSDPGKVLSGLTGAGEVKKAITGSDFNYKSSGSSSSGSYVNTAPAPLNTSSTQTVKVSAASAPATIQATSSKVTSNNVSSAKSSSSSGSSSASSAAALALFSNPLSVYTSSSSGSSSKSSSSSSSSKSSSSSSSSSSSVKTSTPSTSAPTTTSSSAKTTTSSSGSKVTVASTVSSAVSTATKAVTSTASSAAKAVTSTASSATKTVSSVISNAVKSVTSLFSKKK